MGTHPWGECYIVDSDPCDLLDDDPFQWAPTLGGECYCLWTDHIPQAYLLFQWAPTLGGECYHCSFYQMVVIRGSFNGHPPLGVNATSFFLR